jgi:transcription elongation factor GreB
MSRAFVRERDDQPPEPLPEREISAHPNLVTRRGLRLIDERIAELGEALAARPDEAAQARLARDLRYWSARKQTARLAAYPARDDEVALGSRVHLRRDGAAVEAIEIVGEDESDASVRRIAWTAPLAAALIGARAGETVLLENRDPPVAVEILGVERL